MKSTLVAVLFQGQFMVFCTCSNCLERYRRIVTDNKRQRFYDELRRNYQNN